MASVADAFKPNRALDKKTTGLVIAAWLVVGFAVWFASPFKSLPTPIDIWHALTSLWWEGGLGPEIFTTMKLIGHATLLTVVLSMLLSYATVVPVFRPLVEAVSKLRFLGLTGLVFPFTLLTGGGYSLKVWLLTFGMSTFFVTSMARIVVEIPRAEFDYLRVLGASELRIFWEVVVRGTLDRALDVLRQNVAMGWAMITMVEGISRSEGGVGALILNENKHFMLAEVYAILIVILVLGLVMDYGMGVITTLACPHVSLDRVKR
jgi:NitT/TauT family transport system permease protein